MSLDNLVKQPRFVKDDFSFEVDIQIVKGN